MWAAVIVEQLKKRKQSSLAELLFFYLHLEEGVNSPPSNTSPPSTHAENAQLV